MINILVKPVIYLVLSGISTSVIFEGSHEILSVFTSTGLFSGINSLPPQIANLILTIIGFSALLITLAVVFIVKNRALNKKLVQKNSEIEDANTRLEDLNSVLENQRDALAKELVSSEMLYGIMLSSAEDGIAYYDIDWSLQYANTAFYNLIGLEKEEYESIDTKDINKLLIHPDDTEYFRRRSEEIEKNGVFEDELRIKQKNGNYRVLSSKSVLIKDEEGQPLGILIISRDITSLKDVQNELVIARDKAEESNRLKSTFLANISHEIRTPLNSIVGFANLLNDPGTDEETRNEYIGYLNQNTERLLQIIGDIIDLSRLENSEIEIHYDPVRINPLMDFVEDYTHNLISRSGKEIKFSMSKGLQDGKDIIYADEIWLKRVFRHLLDNAVKFTRGGTIEVTSAMAGTSLMFSVKDTGIGISKENLKSIFEQFRQEVDGHHRPFEGLGVGLTLTKHVIEQMDGYLWVESEKGSGSEFFFTIPYRPVDIGVDSVPENSKSEVPGAIDWTGKKILVADDNADILKYLNRILSDTGVDVVEARSGEETLNIVKECDDIDLILLDMQMHEMNGLEAAREIRKIRSDIPIVAQTAFIFEEEKDLIIEAGCDACLIKPIRQDQLYSVVSGFLNDN